MNSFFLPRRVRDGSPRTASQPTIDRRLWLQAALGLIAMMASVTAQAAPRAASSANPADASLLDKPFADHHLALQLSDRDAAKHAMVLSVAYNLLKAYGPDAIAIEVVAFGPGIDLLRKDVPDQARVNSLVAQGVRFSVCMNTVETIERETGETVALNPLAHKVQAGVARILTLTEHGYTLVRP